MHVWYIQDQSWIQVVTTRSNFGVRWSQINQENICTNLICRPSHHFRFFPMCEKEGRPDTINQKGTDEDFYRSIGIPNICKTKKLPLLVKDRLLQFGTLPPSVYLRIDIDVSSVIAYWMMGTYVPFMSHFRKQTDLGWSCSSDGGGSGCVCTMVPPWTPAQIEDWDTRQDQNTVPWPQRSAPGDAQDLVDHQWQYQQEDSYRCSQEPKCGSKSVGQCSGGKVLPGKGNWSGQCHIWQPAWE